VLELHGPQTPVLAMGDFNDEPFDTSLVRHALRHPAASQAHLCAGGATAVEISCGPSQACPMAPSTSTNQLNMLDQFLVNKNMAIGDAAIKVDRATGQIFKLPAMVSAGVNPKPIPFGGTGKTALSLAQSSSPR
jgi:endonuclease/exonuclease/phosphatase family metal-dependent hydrolase